MMFTRIKYGVLIMLALAAYGLYQWGMRNKAKAEEMENLVDVLERRRNKELYLRKRANERSRESRIKVEAVRKASPVDRSRFTRDPFSGGVRDNKKD